MIQKIIFYILDIKYKYLLYGSIVRVQKGAYLQISNRVKIINSNIVVVRNSKLSIGDSSSFKNVNMVVEGEAEFGESNIIENGYVNSKIDIGINGKIKVGSYNRLRCKIMVRFGGSLTIGSYTNINEESEVRTDELVCIGSFNQISYKCMIWDTNTHSIYQYEKRRSLAIDNYPMFGFEYEKPKTSPVNIGDDCWIGREAAILKGTNIGNRCIIGFRTVINEIKTKQIPNSI